MYQQKAELEWLSGYTHTNRSAIKVFELVIKEALAAHDDEHRNDNGDDGDGVARAEVLVCPLGARLPVYTIYGANHWVVGWMTLSGPIMHRSTDRPIDRSGHKSIDK